MLMCIGRTVGQLIFVAESAGFSFHMVQYSVSECFLN